MHAANLSFGEGTPAAAAETDRTSGLLTENNPATAGDIRAAASGAARFRGVILIVDDEPCVCRLTKRLTEGLGFTAVVATSGSEAVQLFAQQPDAIRCVLVDMNMPVMDGAETLRQLRSIRPNLPAVVVSGCSEVEVRFRLQNQSVAGVIAKPYAEAVLESKIAEALGEA